MWPVWDVAQLGSLLVNCPLTTMMSIRLIVSPGSDLGPAREGPSEEQMKEMLAKRAAQLGQAAPTAYGVEQKDEADVDEQRFQDPDNEVGLFGQGNFDQDDDEADRIWQAVDEKMDKRRRVRRLVSPLSYPSPPLFPDLYPECSSRFRTEQIPTMFHRIGKPSSRKNGPILRPRTRSYRVSLPMQKGLFRR
jgi:hypothetical protein